MTPEAGPELTFHERRFLRFGFAIVRALLDDPAVLLGPWETHRQELLADWIEERPGTRPWGFYFFEAPSPRRILERKSAPAGFIDPPLAVAYHDWLRLESEPAYLERHGLLTAAETARLGLGAFEDVWVPESALDWFLRDGGCYTEVAEC